MSAKNKNITYSETHTQLLDAGFTVGVIRSMEMGTKFTSLHIREDVNSGESVHHIVLVKNETARKFRIGSNVCVKLEMFLEERE